MNCKFTLMILFVAVIIIWYVSDVHAKLPNMGNLSVDEFNSLRLMILPIE